jgi:hypothetical protein
MSGTVEALAPAGSAVYCLVFDDLGAVWDGAGFVAPSPPSWPSYAVAMTGPDGGTVYAAAFPDAIAAGTYSAVAYLRSGASPSAGDAPVAFGQFPWRGSFVSSPSDPLFAQAIAAFLNSDPTLAGLVGTRIYPLVRPVRSALPAVTYAVRSAPRTHNLDGPTGDASARLHLAAHGLAYVEDCKAIVERFRTLVGYRGSLAGVVQVKEVLLEDEEDAVDWPENQTDDVVYVTSLELLVRYVEPVLTASP